MNIREARCFLNEQEFIFAKSYSETFPHSYLQRRKATDESGFENFIRIIRSRGSVYSFFKKQYVYLEIDGFVYWEMGRPVPCVQVLNKAPFESLNVNKQTLVDTDVSFILLSKLNQREEYLSTLLKKELKTDQDLRQIDFLMDTRRRIHGGGKNIIDNYKTEIIYE